MAFTTVDGIAAALAATNLQRVRFAKSGTGLEATGAWSTLWTRSSFPVGAAQGSLNGANCDDATTGALPLTNASSGSLYLLGADVSSSLFAGTLLLMDRVWHNSTMSGTATGTNTITQPSLPARITDSGASLLLGLEVFTSWGTTAATLTVNYNDSADGAQSTTCTTTVPGGNGAPTANTFVQLPLANKLGIKAVTSYGWNTTTGTAGNFGLVVFREIARIQVPGSGASLPHNFAMTRLPKIANDSCLFMAWTCSVTGTQIVPGELLIAEG
jgi:hypothetical protein